MEGDLGMDQQDDDNIDDEEEEDEEEEQEDDGVEIKSNLYQQLFETYKKVSAQLAYAEGMGDVLQEYTNLFDAAKKWHLHSEDLEERVKDLEEELHTFSSKYTECQRYTVELHGEVKKLKQELEETMRLADTAHRREQSTMEVVTGLRTELARVSKELGHKARLVVAGGDDPTTMAKRAQENEMREQDRMADELVVVRERLDRAVTYSHEVEKTNAERAKHIEELAEQLEVQESETNKEMRLKERTESDLNATRSQLEQREQDLAALSETHDKKCMEMKTLSENYKDLRMHADRLQRENEAVNNRNNRLQLEQVAQESFLKNIHVEMEQRKRLVKAMELERLRQRKEKAEIRRERDTAIHRAELAQAARGDALHEVDRLRSDVIQSLERDVRLSRKQGVADIRAIERLNREKEILSKSLSLCQDMNNDQALTMRLQEQARRALADELDMHTIAEREQRKKIGGLELERDRMILQTAEMEVRMEETLEEVRLKQMAVYEGKRRVAEGDARYRQQQNLYEAVRADRNTLSKHLLEAQDQILELKQKLKVQGHHVEQLKEDISVKEVDLRRAMRMVDKTDKEKEALRVELMSTRDDLAQARRELVSAAVEERRLLGVIQEAENEHRHMVTEMDQMTNERDILGSQLVRRNDELALLYEKIHLLESALQRGETQYNQRLEDIRLLKIEVRRLRNEKMLLQRSLDNMADLRKEVFHLERDLTRERQKTRALEEELQNPLNVHRWRKLQGTDPNTFDLIEKVQLLQKRLLAQAATAIERETQLNEAQRLYAGLRSLLERQPGPEVTVTLHRTQMALRQRSRKMKVLAAEANMFEAQVTEFKSALERVQSEAEDLKRVNMEQKKRERRLKAAAVAATTKAAAAAGDAQAGVLVPYIGPPSAAGRRFLGGGFNLCSQKA